MRYAPPYGVDSLTRQGVQRVDGDDHSHPTAIIEHRRGDGGHRLTCGPVVREDADRGELQ